MHVQRKIRCRPAPGYTVVELLIVILIISILLAIIIPVGTSVLGISREAATKTTVKKIHESLQKRLDSFNRDYPDSFRRRNGYDWEPANPGDVMDRKFTFKRVFLVDQAKAGATAADNAEVLYRLIIEVEGLGTNSGEASQFGTSEIGDTDGDGNMEFLDGWGNPIVYYPYPTRLFKPGGHTSASNGGVDRNQGASILFGSVLPAPPAGRPQDDKLNRDQDDQFGVLRQTHYNESNYHTFSTYHTPLIVSAGPDGQYGLHLPNDTANFGHLAQPNGNFAQLEDNITNHNTRTGAD